MPRIPFLGRREQHGSVDRRAVLAGAIGATGAAALAGCGPAYPASGTLAGGTTAAAGAAAAAQVPDIVRVTIQVRKAALVDQLYAYFTDPSSARNRLPVVEDFTSPKRLGLPRQLLEAMLIEGDLSHDDVDEFVTGLLSGYDNLVVV